MLVGLLFFGQLYWEIHAITTPLRVHAIIQLFSCLDFILAVSGQCCLRSIELDYFGQVPSLEKGGRDIVLISPLTTCLSLILDRV
nr:hypothetical protein CFP56_43332 [Quercus suber]